jgi:FSR family fosmidomycin resistance protein-like MFS transporter
MKPDKKLLYVISYHHACNDGTLMALVALLPILVEEMDLSYSDIGLLGFGLIVTVVVQLFVGKVADRMFSSYLMEIGALLMGLSFALLLLVSDFTGLFIVVIVMRIGASFYHPVGISWITKEFGGSYLDTALGIQSGIGNLGVIIALGTSGFLGELYGWKTPCLVWTFLNLLAVVMGVLVVRGRDLSIERIPKPAGTSSRQTFAKMAALALPIAAGGALYQITSYFGPLNLTTMHDWSAGNADLMFAIWIGLGTLTSYYFGNLTARFGRKNILRTGYAISACAMVLLFLFSEWYLVLLVVVAFGSVLFLTYPALFAMVTEATDDDERGTAFGILFGFQLGGGAIVVYLCGMLADLTGNPAVSFLVAFALAAGSLVTVVYWERLCSRSTGV